MQIAQSNLQVPYLKNPCHGKRIYRYGKYPARRGTEMKKFKNLVASDFPKINAQKFGVWKAAVMRTRGHVYVVLVIYLVLNIKSYGSTGHIIYDTPIVILIVILLLSQHSRFVSEKHPTYII